MTGPDGAGFRVGDAERDAAVSALGEHFAAGRLTKDEFDERSGRAWAARYGADLDELFTDLPQPVSVRTENVPAAARSFQGRRPPVARLLVMIPLAMMAVGGLLFLIVATAPWLLFIFGLLFLLGGPGGRRRHWQRHGQWPGQWPDGGSGRPGWGPPSGQARPGWGPPSRGEWRQARGPVRPTVAGFGGRGF